MVVWQVSLPQRTMMSDNHVDGASFFRIKFEGTSKRIYGMKKMQSAILYRYAFGPAMSRSLVKPWILAFPERLSGCQVWLKLLQLFKIPIFVLSISSQLRSKTFNSQVTYQGRPVETEQTMVAKHEDRISKEAFFQLRNRYLFHRNH